MKEGFSHFDPVEYLATEDDILAYLEAAAEEGEPAAFTEALSTVARARNMAQLARDANLTREGLYKALRPGSNPSFSTVNSIVRALGFELSLRPIAPQTLPGSHAD